MIPASRPVLLFCREEQFVTMRHIRPPSTSENVTKLMRANRSQNTKPEMQLRKALRDAGKSGYRLNWPLPGKPDVAYPGRKVAIFVHGCYWHSCPRCNKKPPTKNVEYWTSKLAYNRERDAENQRKLAEMGWKTVVIWECELRKDLAGAVARVVEALADAPRQAASANLPAGRKTSSPALLLTKEKGE